MVPKMPARVRIIFVLLMAMLASAIGTPTALARQPLPENPQARQGVLANGLRYLVVHHPAMAGAPARVAMSLRVDFGSLDELDHERGSARAAELLARASILASPAAGTLRTLGVQPEADLQTNVGYEWCSFTLAVPATAPAQVPVRAALEMLSRAFSPPPPASLSPEGWSDLRALMEERERGAMGVMLRANAALMPRLMPGSRYASRFPMGEGSVDPNLSAQTAEAFRSRWLVTPSGTLVIAGDGLTLDELESLARAVFSRLPGAARPEHLPAGNTTADKPIALILHDPGLATDFVQLTRGTTTQDQSAGINTVPAFVDDLTARVMLEIVKRRLEALMSAPGGGGGDPDVARCAAPGPRRAVMPRFSRTFTLTALIAGGPPGSAMDLARSVVAAAKGMKAGSIPDDEIESARAAVQNALDAEARTSAGLSPERIADAYAEAIALRDAPISPAQRAELARTLMPRVTPQAVTNAARDRLDPERAALVALLPETDDDNVKRLTEAALLSALDAPAFPPATITAREGASGLIRDAGTTNSKGSVNAPSQLLPAALAPLPDGAPENAVASAELHPPSGVFTAALSSGVVFHHRAMPSSNAESDDGTRVVLTVAFGFGPADETPDTRGLSTILRAALDDPATSAMNADAVRRASDAAGLTVDAFFAADSVSLRITSRESSAEAAFALAAEIARAGTLDRTVFDRERARLMAMSAQGMRTPEYAVTDVYPRALFPDDSRPRAPSAHEASEMTFERASAFVTKALASVSIEAAVTGDIDRARALDLATRAFATLPPRRALGRATQIALVRPARPVESVEPINTPDRRSAVFEGYQSVDETDAQSVVALDVAAEALSARLATALRERLRLSMNPRVEHYPSRGWKSAGDFRATASCSAGREGALRAELRDQLSRFASEPLPEAELAAARQRVAAKRAEELSDPVWWSARLAVTTRRGLNLSDFLAAPARTLALKPDDVRTAYQSIATDNRRISITVKPK